MSIETMVKALSGERDNGSRDIKTERKTDEITISTRIVQSHLYLVTINIAHGLVVAQHSAIRHIVPNSNRVGQSNSLNQWLDFESFDSHDKCYDRKSSSNFFL